MGGKLQPRGQIWSSVFVNKVLLEQPHSLVYRLFKLVVANLISLHQQRWTVIAKITWSKTHEVFTTWSFYRESLLNPYPKLYCMYLLLVRHCSSTRDDTHIEQMRLLFSRCL